MQIHDPQSAGLSATRLTRLDAAMHKYTRADRLPGVMTLLQRHGKVIHLGKYGHMNIETQTPIQEDTLFRIFSMTKPITSIALMMLYEEGHFSLQEPVAKFIPAFAKTKVYTGNNSLGMKLVDQENPVTLYHLLTHTAGLSYGWFVDSPVEDVYRQAANSMFRRDQPLAESVDVLAGLPLLFQPGTQWRYSMASDVLGQVIQVVADMPLEDFFRERIFAPLNMTETAFTAPADKLHRLAQIYSSEKLYDPVVLPPDQVMLIGDITQPTQSPTGGAGLVSTLGDYLNFCNFLLNKGSFEGKRLLSRKTIEWMTVNHMPASFFPLKIGEAVLDFGFGLGFRVTTALAQARSLTSVGQFGWAGAANTYFWVDPAEDFIGIMMTQHMPVEPYPVQERFRILAYQAIAD